MHRPMGQNHTETTGVSWIQTGWLELASEELCKCQGPLFPFTPPCPSPFPCLHMSPCQGPRRCGPQVLASSAGAARCPAQEAL